MPLRIRLAPNEKFVVNGAVLINGDKRNTLTVSNPANILRERDIIFAEDAITPAGKAYFLVQSLVFTAGTDKAGISKNITDALVSLYTAFASDEVRANVMEAANQFNAGDLYKSLAALNKVLAYERSLTATEEKEDNHVNDDEPSNRVGHLR